MTRALQRLAIAGLALAALLAALPAAAAPPRDGSHDFDFTFGTWTEHSRRLMHPLTGSNEWAEWDGRTVVRKIWDGRANMAEFKGVTPSGPLELIALRIYNPATGQWSLDFATAGVGKLGDIAGVGEFKDGRIDFYDQEPLNGRAILVRFSVYATSPTTHVSEQAFSADGGKTWEVNWINRYTLESRASEPEGGPARPSSAVADEGPRQPDRVR